MTVDQLVASRLGTAALEIPGPSRQRLAAYQINLDSRTDRWAECVKNHQSTGFHDKIARFSACQEKDFGALGCAKSHIKLLSDFYCSSSAPYCLVLEDDFDFVSSADYLLGALARVVESKLEWDTIVLSGTAVLAFPSETFIAKLFECQTTAAYVVRRQYVPVLLKCFIDSAVDLERLRDFQPREIVASRYAIDMAWKHLQRRDKWFILQPMLGVQRPSFSDVEGRYVDYSRMYPSEQR